MFSVHYTEPALASLKSYLLLLETSQIGRFLDSGLWCEDLIIATYREKSKEFFHLFRIHIEKRLSQDTVLGYRPDPDRP